MKPLILACDDSPVIQVVLNKGLSMASPEYEVIVAEDGNQVKEILADRQPVIFLTDLELPDCHGIELLRLCHRLYPACPLGAMSASIDKDHMVALKEMNIKIILVKPIRVDVLEKILLHYRLKTSN